MSKYIDADILQEKLIERLGLFEELSSDTISPIRIDECKKIIGIIDSLQQEQPEVDLENEIRRFLTNATKMGKGEWRGKYAINDIGFRAVARHFYELGQKDAANKYDAGFKAGSQWLAEQGVSVEANIMDSSGSGYLSLIMPNNINNRYKFFNDGDRVIVQVRKKEESK